jgi:CheY-like chemotaxis protein
VIREAVSCELAPKPCNILCVGRAEELLSLRGLVLHGAGYRVIEERDITRAIQIGLLETTDLVLLCHTLNSDEQHRIIHALRTSRPHLPIACVIAADHHGSPAGSLAVPSDPQRLIEAIHKMFRQLRSESE